MVPRSHTPSKCSDGRATTTTAPPWRELHVVDTGSGVASPFITGQIDVRRSAGHPTDSASPSRRSAAATPTRRCGRFPCGAVRRSASRRCPRPASPATASAATAATWLSSAPKRPAPTRNNGMSRVSTREIYEEDWRPGRIWVTHLGKDGRAAEVGEPLAVGGHVTRAAWNPSCEPSGPARGAERTGR